jgi:hypothetical protein
MNRRAFFRLTAGAVAVAAIVPPHTSPNISPTDGEYRGRAITITTTFDTDETFQWRSLEEALRNVPAGPWIGERGY